MFDLHLMKINIFNWAANCCKCVRQKLPFHLLLFTKENFYMSKCSSKLTCSQIQYEFGSHNLSLIVCLPLLPGMVRWLTWINQCWAFWQEKVNQSECWVMTSWLSIEMSMRARHDRMSPIWTPDYPQHQPAKRTSQVIAAPRALVVGLYFR